MSENNILAKVKRISGKLKKLNNDEISKVSGAGNEPEEFGWESKEYITPEKKWDEKDGWVFESIGDKENNNSNPFKK